MKKSIYILLTLALLLFSCSTQNNSPSSKTDSEGSFYLIKAGHGTGRPVSGDQNFFFRIDSKGEESPVKAKLHKIDDHELTFKVYCDISWIKNEELYISFPLAGVIRTSKIGEYMIVTDSPISVDEEPKHTAKLSQKISYCYLNARNIILSGKYFRFSLKKKIENEQIELSGIYTANTNLNFIDKEMPTKLKNIKMKIYFLGADALSVIYSEEISLEYEESERPSIFEKIPITITFPYNPEYVNVGIQYVADVEYLPNMKEK